MCKYNNYNIITTIIIIYKRMNDGLEELYFVCVFSFWCPKKFQVFYGGIKPPFNKKDRQMCVKNNRRSQKVRHKRSFCHALKVVSLSLIHGSLTTFEMKSPDN